MIHLDRKMQETFPKISIREFKLHNATSELHFIRCSTFIRKQEPKSGIWYLWHVYKEYEVSQGTDRYNYIQQFITECYHVLILGIVTPELITEDGRNIFYKDSDQMTEEERLKAHLIT